MFAGVASSDVWDVCEGLGVGSELSGGVVEVEAEVEVCWSDVV